MASIDIVNLTKRFGRVLAVDDLSLEIPDRSFVALLGPSGCGKSTTMNMIAGIEEPTAGEIRFDGRNIMGLPANKRDIGFVFQNYAIFTHMTVFENLAFALRVRRVSSREVMARVRAIAETMNLTERLNAPASRLSVNEMQKLAIGRSAIFEPAIFLLDEPLSNVDAAFRTRMRTELKHLQHRLGQTMVYVTHDQIEAMSLADKIAVIDQGVLQQYGTPFEVYNSPASLFVANFIGSPSMNLVDARIESHDGDFAVRFGSGESVTTPAGSRLARLLAGRKSPEVVFGIRPEDVSVSLDKSDSGGILLKAGFVEPIGPRTILHLGLGAGMLKVVTEKRFAARTGDFVNAQLRLDKCHLFDPATGLALAREGGAPHGDA